VKFTGPLSEKYRYCAQSEKQKVFRVGNLYYFKVLIQATHLGHVRKCVVCEQQQMRAAAVTCEQQQLHANKVTDAQKYKC